MFVCVLRSGGHLREGFHSCSRPLGDWGCRRPRSADAPSLPGRTAGSRALSSSTEPLHKPTKHTGSQRAQHKIPTIQIDGHSLDQWFLTWVRSNPRGSLSHSQGFGRGQDTHSIARITLAILGRFYIYLYFEEIIFYFSNYEGFGECTDEVCRVQYLQ